MKVSANEVYQIIKKSCVSEGIYEDWGDDIGKTIAFLHKNNINGCEYFNQLINDLNSKKNIFIKREKNILHIENLNPIMNAIPVIDWLISGINKEALIYNQIFSPIIFFSLLVKNCQNYGGTFKIINTKDKILYKINSNFKFKEIDELIGKFRIKWSKCNILKNLIRPKIKMHTVNLETWKILEKKAYKTFVPETTVSRNFGAGAGLFDND